MWKRKLKKNDDDLTDWVEEEEKERGCKGQKSLERLWEKEKEKRF